MNDTEFLQLQKIIDDYLQKESDISKSLEKHVSVLIKDLDKIHKILNK